VSELAQLVTTVQAGAKYRQVHPALIQRIGAAELSKGRSLKQATKATKNKLHQVGGAYLQSRVDYPAWLEKLEKARGDRQTLQSICREVMALHASTRERLPILETFYQRIFSELLPIHSVLDLACGLNPLALPWMPLAENARYQAYDIYTNMMTFVGHFMDLLAVSGEAQACDVLGELPGGRYDLALLLKTLPCLEQIEKDVGTRLLETIDTAYLLVSFPVRSLGGRDKGMAENYPTRFMETVKGYGWGIKRFDFEVELAFLIEKPGN